jgi:hypothetical protein
MLLVRWSMCFINWENISSRNWDTCGHTPKNGITHTSSRTAEYIYQLDKKIETQYFGTILYSCIDIFTRWILSLVLYQRLEHRETLSSEKGAYHRITLKGIGGNKERWQHFLSKKFCRIIIRWSKLNVHEYNPKVHISLLLENICFSCIKEHERKT